jgi:alcohol dehydrogenase class IV
MRFTFAREPRLEFGPGSLASLPRILAERESVEGPFSLVVLVTGGASFRSGPKYAEILAALAGRRLLEFSCPGEPSPDFVDRAVAAVAAALGAGEGRCAVVGIGGGSAMDAGKAVAALVPVALRESRAGRPVPSVQDYLEGVGTKEPEGLTAFYAAVPTTAGTGTEATKNAVISRVGPGGFKKSLRHDAYCPAVAIVDPELALGCPRSVGAASGLDAFTQLLEAYLSPAASPIVEALCESGIAAFGRSFLPMLADGSDLEARSGMAYAAYLSGIALANAGLGSVHALASPVGGRFPAPHGVVCGLLLGPAARLNIDLLAEAARTGDRLDRRAAEAALAKYGRAGGILGGTSGASDGCDGLLEAVGRFEAAAALPRLAAYGVSREDVPSLAAAAATKTNPLPLGAAEYESLILSVL